MSDPVASAAAAKIALNPNGKRASSSSSSANFGESSPSFHHDQTSIKQSQINSKNINNLVSQSNSYWQAERAFFNLELTTAPNQNSSSNNTHFAFIPQTITQYHIPNTNNSNHVNSYLHPAAAAATQPIPPSASTNSITPSTQQKTPLSFRHINSNQQQQQLQSQEGSSSSIISNSGEQQEQQQQSDRFQQQLQSKFVSNANYISTQTYLSIDERNESVPLRSAVPVFISNQKTHTTKNPFISATVAAAHPHNNLKQDSQEIESMNSTDEMNNNNKNNNQNNVLVSAANSISQSNSKVSSGGGGGGGQQKIQQPQTFSLSYTDKNATSLPSERFQWKSLETISIIDLSGNKFREIPEQILSCVNLRVLIMDNNLIKVLPQTLFYSLWQLEHLSLANNLVFELPSSIKNSGDSLKFLDVSLNRIDDLTFIKHLIKLKCLRINNNDFRRLPTSLRNLSELQELSLDWFSYAQPRLDMVQNGKFGARIIRVIIEILNSILPPLESISFYEFVDALSQKVHRLLYSAEQPFEPFNIAIRDAKDAMKSLAHKAAEREEIGCLVAILERDFSLIDSIDEDNHTPLSLSILHERFFSAKTLISNGANPNLGGSKYGSCLNLATIKYQYYLVLDLLKRGANPNQTDSDGNTPLHYVMTIYHRDVVYSEKISDLLLEYGADPNAKNIDLWAPIHLLSRKGEIMGFQYIFNYNAKLKEEAALNPSVATASFEVNIASASAKKLELEKEKVEKCAFSIDIRGGKDKKTPLMIACTNCCYEAVVQLLKNGADIFARDAFNRVALQMSMRDNFLYKLLKLKEMQVFSQFFKRPSSSNTAVNRNQNIQSQQRLNPRSISPFRGRTLQVEDSTKTPPRQAISSTNTLTTSTNQTNYKQNDYPQKQISSQTHFKQQQQFLQPQESKISKGQLDKFSPLLSKQIFKRGEEQCETLSGGDDDTDTKLFIASGINILSDYEDIDSTSPASFKPRGNNQNYFQPPQSHSQFRYNQHSAKKVINGSNVSTMNCLTSCSGPVATPAIPSAMHIHYESCDIQDGFNPAEIDEERSIHDFMNTKQKVLNKNMSYSPNDISQLKSISSINKSKFNQTSQPDPSQTQLSSSMNSSRQRGSQMIERKIGDQTCNSRAVTPPPVVSAGTGGATIPPPPSGIVKSQHIGVFKYLVEKARNMHEFYRVSLESYRKGILSHFNNLYERFRYLAIMQKLQIEYTLMARHLYNEKTLLSSQLGMYQQAELIQAIDEAPVHLSIVRVLQDIASRLRTVKSLPQSCDSKIKPLTQGLSPMKEYTNKNRQNDFNNTNNISYWMRQYEEDTVGTLHTNPGGGGGGGVTPVKKILNNSDDDETDKEDDEPENMYLDKLSFPTNVNEELETEDDCDKSGMELFSDEVLKESVIASMAQFSLNSQLDYFAEESRSSETSLINAFEAAHAYFRITNSQPPCRNSSSSNTNNQATNRNTNNNNNSINGTNSYSISPLRNRIVPADSKATARHSSAAPQKQKENEGYQLKQQQQKQSEQKFTFEKEVSSKNANQLNLLVLRNYHSNFGKKQQQSEEQQPQLPEPFSFPSSSSLHQKPPKSIQPSQPNIVAVLPPASSTKPTQPVLFATQLKVTPERINSTTIGIAQQHAPTSSEFNQRNSLNNNSNNLTNSIHGKVNENNNYNNNPTQFQSSHFTRPNTHVQLERVHTFQNNPSMNEQPIIKQQQQPYLFQTQMNNSSSTFPAESSSSSTAGYPTIPPFENTHLAFSNSLKIDSNMINLSNNNNNNYQQTEIPIATGVSGLQQPGILARDYAFLNTQPSQSKHNLNSNIIKSDKDESNMNTSNVGDFRVRYSQFTTSQPSYQPNIAQNLKLSKNVQRNINNNNNGSNMKPKSNNNLAISHTLESEERDNSFVLLAPSSFEKLNQQNTERIPLQAPANIPPKLDSSYIKKQTSQQTEPPNQNSNPDYQQFPPSFNYHYQQDNKNPPSSYLNRYQYSQNNNQQMPPPFN